MLRRAERWLFAPGDPRALAGIRIGLCSLLAIRLTRPLYVGLAGQPRELFRPVSFMHLFSSMPSRSLTIVVQIAGVSAAVAAAAGLRSRVTLPLAWACALLLNGMATSTGKVVHNDVLLLLAMVPLLVAPTSDAWSLDASRRPPRLRPVMYGWPVRTAMVVVAGTYFWSGLAKLVFSGPAWVTGGNLRWVLYTASDARARPVAAALFIADRPWLAHLLAAATLLVELGFPLVLVRPRLAWFFVPGAAALHLGIWLTLHLDYSAWAITDVVVFGSWAALATRVRRATAQESQSAASLA